MTETKRDYYWPVTSQNAVIYQHFLFLVEQIKSKIKDKRIVIYGAGIRGCLLMQILEKFDFANIIFCDNNPEKQGHLIRKYAIISFNETLCYSGEQVILVSPEDSGSITWQLNDAELKEGIDWVSFDISIYDTYISEYKRTMNDYLLVMGDCGITHIALTDSITDSLGDMIKTKIGAGRCKVLAMHGIGQQANAHIITSLLDRGKYPSLVIMLLVLEVLTSKAHLMPRTQHPALIHKLIDSIDNPNQEFINYAKLTSNRFNQLQVESFINTNVNTSEENEKLFMKMNYLFKIKEETEGVIYLKRTIKSLNIKGIPIVLYIPPVNYMQGRRFFGDDFLNRYTDNFKKLYGFLNKEGLKYSVADASLLLGEDEFAAVNTIDETANYNGRMKLLSFLEKNARIHEFY